MLVFWRAVIKHLNGDARVVRVKTMPTGTNIDKQGDAINLTNRWVLTSLLAFVCVLGLSLILKSIYYSVGTESGAGIKSCPTDHKICLMSPRLCLKRSISLTQKSIV